MSTVIQMDRSSDPPENSLLSERGENLNLGNFNFGQTGENEEEDQNWEADDEQEDGDKMSDRGGIGEKAKIRGKERHHRTSSPYKMGDPPLKATGDFPECSQVVIMAGVCDAQGTVATFTYDDLPNSGEGLDVFERAEAVIGLMHEHIRQLKRNAEERKEALFQELLDIIYKDYANHLHASVWSYRVRLAETFELEQRGGTAFRRGEHFIPSQDPEFGDLIYREENTLSLSPNGAPHTLDSPGKFL